ncbi:MAG: YncE family protein, partial [candidate division WOR-3 bacterium]|nr:YncE family protein [candidate division WOR-3 bacterium]
DAKVYCANYYSDNVTVIDGATNGVIATVAVGTSPCALCYNPTNNKVYCANRYSDNMTVIDGATNSVIATVAAGDLPQALCYNPTADKVYCSNGGVANVTVVDGATNSVVATVGVGDWPFDFCHNPIQNRVYVGNTEGSSISVLRDSGGGIEESFKPQATSHKPSATVVRAVLFLAEAASPKPQATSLLDISGRKVLALRPGANDVRALSPGVYFVREASSVESEASSVTKVVLTR